MIVFCAVVGTYSVRFQAFDVWVMLLFGVLGYFMRKFGFPVAPMVLASVLAQMLETALGQSLLISQGSLADLLHPPHLGRLHGLAFLSIGRGIWVADAGQGARNRRGRSGLSGSGKGKVSAVVGGREGASSETYVAVSADAV